MPYKCYSQLELIAADAFERAAIETHITVCVNHRFEETIEQSIRRNFVMNNSALIIMSWRDNTAATTTVTCLILVVACNPLIGPLLFNWFLFKYKT